MSKVFTYLVSVLLAFYSTIIIAADIPDDVIDARQFNSEQCIDENTQECINNQCLTSEERNCQDKCADLAKAKCQQQSN